MIDAEIAEMERWSCTLVLNRNGLDIFDFVQNRMHYMGDDHWILHFWTNAAGFVDGIDGRQCEIILATILFRRLEKSSLYHACRAVLLLIITKLLVLLLCLSRHQPLELQQILDILLHEVHFHAENVFFGVMLGISKWMIIQKIVICRFRNTYWSVLHWLKKIVFVCNKSVRRDPRIEPMSLHIRIIFRVASLDLFFVVFLQNLRKIIVLFAPSVVFCEVLFGTNLLAPN